MLSQIVFSQTFFRRKCKIDVTYDKSNINKLVFDVFLSDDFFNFSFTVKSKSFSSQEKVKDFIKNTMPNSKKFWEIVSKEGLKSLAKREEDIDNLESEDYEQYLISYNEDVVSLLKLLNPEQF